MRRAILFPCKNVMDQAPNAFTFTDVTNATTSTLYTSNTITVTGINATTPYSVTGGQVSKNGGAFSSSSGTVVPFDTLAVQGTSSLSPSTQVDVTLTVGGVSDTYSIMTAAAGDSITSDAFSSYATRVIDSATASDVAGGTTRTVTINGVSGSYQCYKTIPFAVNDYLTAGGRRLVVKSGSYTLGADVPFPSATGLSDTTRVVVMGDPADTMPAITMGGFTFWPNRDGARSYITLRKLELKDGTGLINAGSTQNCGGVWTANAPASCSFMNLEFMYIHDFVADEIDNAALVVLSNTQNCIVRNSKINNISRSDAVGNYQKDNNLSGILAYDADALVIHHNDIGNARNGVRPKRMTTNSGNGWTVYSNKIYDTGVAFDTEVSASSNPPHIGHQIYNNLAYSSVSGAQFLNAEEIGSLSGQSRDWSVHHNTTDVDYSMLLTGVLNWDFHSNVFAGGAHRHFETLSSGSNSQSFTRCDYDAWFNQVASSYRLYNSGSQLNFATLATFKTAKSVSGATDFSADPEAHGVNITSLSSEFTNIATRDYSLKIGSQLRGAGLSGSNIGFDWTDYGAGW